MSTRTSFGLAAAAAFIAAVVLANYLTARYGFVPVGFGQAAAAGTFAAGLALGLRDLIHDGLGRVGAVSAVVLAAVVSLVVAPPALAVASGLAFLVSELADMLVYTPLRRKAEFGGARWSGAVLASNLVGAVVDTVVFLWVAFGLAAVMPGVAGQMIAKMWMTMLVISIGWAAGRVVLRNRLNAARA